MTYVRGINPVWLFADLRGHLFDDTFYMFVLENTIPYIPATVYHASTGTPWTNPIRFFANGTLPVDIFFDPGTAENPIFYRLEFRQGPTQADPLIYLIENYSPVGFAGSSPLTSVASFTDNQVANPQFALVNFQSPLSITAAGTYEIAPGWFLDLTGAGTATLEQTPLNSSVTTINPTNAPYALHIVLTGWGAASLRQRFQQNGMLWASTSSVSKYVASSITAKINGIAQNINADLVDSMGQVLGPVLNSTVVSTNWTEYPDHLLMPVTTNTNVPPDAYIDYRLHFETPGNADLFVTSFQLVSSNVALNFSYMQDSIDRQIDHLFHYYKDPLIFKQIPSYLVGWDFPMNPTQPGVPGSTSPASTVPATAIGANKSKYVWDQTIIFQSADSAIGAARGPSRELLLTAAATTQMAIIQYLGAIEARKILNSPLCVNVYARASTDTVATVSLWYTKDVALPVLTAGTNNSLVLTLDANGKPATFNGTWLEVPRANGNAQITIETNVTSGFNDYPLSGWDMAGVADVNLANFFAIVVGTASVASTGTIGFESVSLQAGSLPTRPAPLTINETLLQCQYYCQKSFFYDISPHNNAGLDSGETYGVQTKGSGATPTVGPLVRFDQFMRTIPTVTLYNPSGGAAGEIYNVSTTLSWVGSGPNKVSENGFSTQGTTDVGSIVGNEISVHWFADARLGLV